MTRWAIVVTLASGLKATYSKRGRVDWEQDLFGAVRIIKMVRAALDTNTRGGGYLKPDYELYGVPARLVFKKDARVDMVIDVQAVPEGEWSADKHHTIPRPTTP